MISFEPLNMVEIDWDEVAALGEVNIFQSSSWLKFLSDTHQAIPLIAAIKSDGHRIGYFTGVIVKKYGIKILGSPFRGLGTYFMGFNLAPGYSRQSVLQSFPNFAFKELGCHYLEIIDPEMCLDGWDGHAYGTECLNWFVIDLTPSEDKLFSRMESSGRNCIRKAIRSGVSTEAVEDINFAEEYYSQYQSIMALHNLVPTYGLDYVKNMIEYLLPTGNLLLLRSRADNGLSIATGIFLALNKTAVFWGAASLREYQSLRPNEPLAWEGMKRLKARGIRILHLGGTCDQYKKKLGGMDACLYRLRKTRFRVLDYLIKIAISPGNDRYKNWMLRRL